MITNSPALTGRDKTTPHLRLACLGPPRAWLDEQPLTFPTRKALALLIYLAVEGGPQPRPKLMALFWPDSDSARARSALRSTLAYLRRPLEALSPGSSDHFLHLEGDAVGLNFGPEFELDIHALDLAQDLESLEQATARYRGDFLEGFSLPDAPDFDDWASLQRERWHQAMTPLFDQFSRLQLETRRFQAAIAVAGRWITHSPLDEAAHRRLMHAYALAGNRAAAWQAYQTCRAALQAELGLEPSPETEHLRLAIDDSVTSGYLRLEKPQPKAKSENPKSAELPFVGRSTEYAQLVRCYQQVNAGQTRLVVIKGEAGIGKTRLAEEFLLALALQGADILKGRAFEAGGRLPYQPLVDALRHRLERENAPDDLLDDVWLVELSRLLPELQERYPDLPPPTLDETLGRLRLSEAVARLGKTLARRRPATLYLDDIQWADAASLDLLHYACRSWRSEQTPILLLVTLRVESLATSPDVRDWLLALEREVPLTQLALNALTAEETGQLIETLGKEQDRETEISPAPLRLSSPAVFARWLYQETAGQPFFINETLRALAEQSQAVEAMPPAGLLPPGVRQVIMARLAHLTPTATALLTASAVLGRPASFERLCQVTDTPENEALAALDLLLNHHLLKETGDARRPYAVAHDKIRDVVYTEAGDARRRIYHRRAFAALEQAVTSHPELGRREHPELSRRAAELAHHALKAHLPEPAFRYSVSAGDAAMQLFAVRDAINFYEQARALLANNQLLITNYQLPISNLYTHLARAYEVAEKPSKVELICQEMLTLARQSAWPTLECAALNRLASLAIYAQQMEQATTLLAQAKQVAEANGDTAGLAQTEWGLGQLTHHIDDFTASQLHSQRALALARELGDPALITGTTQTLAFALLFQGQLAAGAAAMAAAKEGYAALGNRALEADALVGLAFAHILNGQAAGAVEAARLALVIGQEIENEFGQCMSRAWLVCGLVDQGHYEEALVIARRNLAAANSQALAPQILAAFSAGLLYWALGDAAAAQKVHQELMPHVEAAGVPGYLEQNLANLGVDAALAGDWDAAYHYARQALAHRTYQSLPLLVKPHWPETEALLRGGDIELARQDTRRWGERVEHVPRLRVGHLRSLALLAEWGGDHQQAITQLQDALSLAENIDLPGEQWQILAKLGEMYRAIGEEGQAQQALDQAVEIVQALTAKIDDESLRAKFTTIVRIASSRTISE